MKAKIDRGQGFRGVLNYGFGARKEAEIVGGNMVGSDPRALAAEFRLGRSIRPEVARPVVHCSLACPEGEVLSADRWRAVSDRFMELMGLDGHQFVALRHRDTALDHIHIIGSRIRLDGQLWHGQWEAYRAIQATQQIEREFGLTLTPGLDDRPDALPAQAPRGTGKKSPKKQEIEKADRTGDAPVRLRLQEILDGVLDGPQSVVAFMERLEAAGVAVVPNIARTGRMNGFSFALDGVPFKASQLGKRYAWKALQERGVEYVEDRDAEALRARADRGAAPDGAQPGREPGGAGGGAGASGDGRLADREPVRRLAGGDGEPVPADGGGGDDADRGGLGAGGGPDRAHGAGSGAEGRAGLGDRGAGGADRAGDRADPDIAAVVADGSDGSGLDARWRGHADRVADLASPEPCGAGGALPEDPRPLTGPQRAKVAAWRAQHGALDAPAYRVTLMWVEGDGKRGRNLGKGRGEGGGEKLYAAAEIEGLVPYLSRENLLGRNVYITPIDPAHHYLVVDDMTPASLEALEAEGFRPALVQETSPGSLQAVLKVPRAGDGEQQAANMVVAGLNRRYGDPRFSGAIHPFRLAGFANKKPGKGSPFTRILRALGGLCVRTGELLAQARAQLAAAAKARVMPPKASGSIPAAPSGDPLVGAEAEAAGMRHDALRAQVESLVAEKGWELDPSAIDFRVAKGMLEEGFARDEIASALAARSPGIRERHRDLEGYLERTLAAAAEGRPEGRPDDGAPYREPSGPEGP